MVIYVLHKDLNKYKFVATALALLLSFPAASEDRALAKVFAQHGVDGTMVISSRQTGRMFVHNDPRANQRFAVASTFKIMNTLIALEEKAIAGKADVFRWDGHSYDFPDWNHDQTLESAFKLSCVWCYQQLARRIGADKYRSYLKKSGYGELREPFEETIFWLDGSLQVSAVEQVDFLKKVYLRSLPFKTPGYETLRQIMLVEQTPTFSIWAKSGWAARVNPQIGWFVGYVETKMDTWFFAMNMEVRDKADLPLRQKLTREALTEKGIIK